MPVVGPLLGYLAPLREAVGIKRKKMMLVPEREFGEGSICAWEETEETTETEETKEEMPHNGMICVLLCPLHPLSPLCPFARVTAFHGVFSVACTQGRDEHQGLY